MLSTKHFYPLKAAEVAGSHQDFLQVWGLQEI